VSESYNGLSSVDLHTHIYTVWKYTWEGVLPFLGLAYTIHLVPTILAPHHPPSTITSYKQATVAVSHVAPQYYNTSDCDSSLNYAQGHKSLLLVIRSLTYASLLRSMPAADATKASQNLVISPAIIVFILEADLSLVPIAIRALQDGMSSYAMNGSISVQYQRQRHLSNRVPVLPAMM
jgi:hypothetical protein